jgi:hypothetical protein
MQQAPLVDKTNALPADGDLTVNHSPASHPAT